ncbi:MAG: 50S ribosomal protein L15 [bacterium]
MRIHTITSTNPIKSGRRVGRGISAGQGKTAGRGTKGQKARTGANSNIPRTFDGGATNFVQRLPKLKGFTSARLRPVTINLATLARSFEDKAVISLTSLVEKGIIDEHALKSGVKIVGTSGKIEKSFKYDLEDTRLRIAKSLQA